MSFFAVYAWSDYGVSQESLNRQLDVLLTMRMEQKFMFRKKLSRWTFLFTLAVVPALAPSLSGAGEKREANEPASSAIRSYSLQQSGSDLIDYNTYESIREEGLTYSHVMEYASALMDGIGPRLTGSPNAKRANEWTRDQLKAMGCTNSHLEDWGEFGMAWEQVNTSVRMVSPTAAVLIAQASPWSPSTKGVVTGPAIWVDVKTEKDFEKYKGKLAGKIVLLGDMRDVKPLEKPLFVRLDDNELSKLLQYPVQREDRSKELEQEQEYRKRREFREKTGQFLAAEGVAGVLLPSRDGRNGGGSGGTFFDDNGSAFGRFYYRREHAPPLPVVVLAIEHYGRIFRLLKANVPVEIEMSVESRFGGDHEHGFNTIAEIPGTDPGLKDEVVLLGAHLDSWASGTGATDNGAGAVVSIEVMRILNALHIRPRRTIRVALWTGEEQGLLGSLNYVKQHFGSIPRSTKPDQLELSEFDRDASGPIELKPEDQTISAYFNLDNGGGKIRGVFLQDNSAVKPIFEKWMEPLKDLGASTITLQDTGGTDHEAFDAIGIPAFQFIQDPLDYGSKTHHSNMDVYERLQPDDLAQAAVVEAIFVYNTAMRDQMLPRKPLPHPEMDEQRSSPLKSVMPGTKTEELER